MLWPAPSIMRTRRFGITRSPTRMRGATSAVVEERSGGMIIRGNTGYVCGLSSGCRHPEYEGQALNSRYRTQYQPGVLTRRRILIGPIKSQNMIYAPITIFGYGDCYPSSQTEGQGAANPYRDPGLERK